jgi:hypothetical protein
MFRSCVLRKGDAVRLRGWARVAAEMEVPAASHTSSAQ